MFTVSFALRHLCTAATVLALTAPGAVYAQAQTYALDIPAQDLGSALKALAGVTGQQVVFREETVRSKRSVGLSGRYTVDDALAAMLRGTSLGVSRSGRGVIVIKPAKVSEAGDDNVSEIVVTGSSIRGARSASNVVIVTQQQMRDAGQNSVADVFRDLPQNSGGGQNPGVGNGVPERLGANYSGASTINLRGLGQDATLTLLNGHRLAYNSLVQGVDISAIPFLAIDRIEVMADGASAIYGSDAVAGVANVILKRDYDGLGVSARLGGSTDGGNFQQQYGVVAGKQWNSGGVMLAYEFARSTEITSIQRSYAKDRSPGLTLFPALKHHNLALTAHQDLSESLIFDIDALYNDRRSTKSYPYEFGKTYLENGTIMFMNNRNFAVSPSLKLSLPRDFQASLVGFYGFDRSRYSWTDYFDSQPVGSAAGCYCNDASSIEFKFDGPLFPISAGFAKIAVGGGYRSHSMHAYRWIGSEQDFKVSQRTYYAFGEIDLPVFTPAQAIGGFRSLNFTAAARYERYPDIDTIVTPKFGAIYSPVQGVELKGSWGKSFKAPSLYQQYSDQFTFAFSPTFFGDSGYPAGSTALLLTGGGDNLKPEKATSWSVTSSFTPASLPNAKLDVTYFKTRYRDRVVSPITYLTSALSDASYSDFVTLNPSLVQVEAAIAGRRFANYSGSAFIPGNVVAIADSSNINAAVQNLKGFDVTGSYRLDVGTDETLQITGSISRLTSSQRLSAKQSETAMAGTLFNPPHFRGRAGIVWATPSFTLGGLANHIGGLNDNRTTTPDHIGSMTTVDFNARFNLDRIGVPINDLSLTVSVQNAFNAKPDVIVTTAVYETTYDSTNYSPIGRFVGVTLAGRL